MERKERIEGMMRVKSEGGREGGRREEGGREGELEWRVRAQQMTHALAKYIVQVEPRK